MVGADTPKTRGEIRYSDSSGSAGKLKTPKGSRLNPFESHVSMDTIHLPTFSPSVFSTVLSPSQESVSRIPDIMFRDRKIVSALISFLILTSFIYTFSLIVVDFGLLINKQCC